MAVPLTAVESLFTEGFLRVLKSRLLREPKVLSTMRARSKAGGGSRAITFGRETYQGMQYTVNKIKTNLTKNFYPSLFGF